MIGFIQFVTNVCLYLAADSGGMTVVGTYVDDLLVTGTDKGSVSPFFVEMGGLELKGLSVTSHFLGMSVQYDGQSGYKFGQEAAIVEMLTKFGLAKANSVRAPIGGEDPAETDVADLLPHATKEMTPTELTVASFQSLVGSLLWIARCTRSDMFAVHCATRRAHAPTMTDSLEACYANRQIPEWHPISQVGHVGRRHGGGTTASTALLYRRRLCGRLGQPKVCERGGRAIERDDGFVAVQEAKFRGALDNRDGVRRGDGWWTGTTRAERATERVEHRHPAA
ncbi:hypothetical protein PC116_g17217 [Phytophthora cactorum]|nr:hypothetical protein Pcac1_g12714 [Phytophthora cactorum]KAG4234612.1 hypothetical protein PC116_g17217 [Phytophthora cactorum]